MPVNNDYTIGIDQSFGTVVPNIAYDDNGNPYGTAGSLWTTEYDTIPFDPLDVQTAQEMMNTHIRMRQDYMTGTSTLTMEQMRALQQEYLKMNLKQEPKPVNVMPRKMNKLKEWSISARALKRVINNACNYRARYDYKFGAVNDGHYALMRIWNVKTRNVVCTVKTSGNKVIIRYRPNSYYASVMSGLNGTKIDDRDIIAIPSIRLNIHRGNIENAVHNLSGSKDAQLGLRRKMFDEAMTKKAKAERKKEKGGQVVHERRQAW